MKKIVYRKSVDLNKYPLINKFSDPLMKSNVVRASRNYKNSKQQCKYTL